MKALVIVALFPALCLAAAVEKHEPVPLPDLRGQPVAQALAMLEKLKLHATQIRIENSAPIGNVVFQDPQPKAQVPVGSLVQLKVSMGTPVTKSPGVPELIGLTLAQATATASQFNLRLRQNGSAPSPQPSGTIAAQNPAAHSSIPDNRLVYVTLAAALPVTKVVPGVIGDSLAYAVQTIGNAGFTTGKQLSRADPGPSGIVIDQYPPPGQTAAPGAPVTLTLSQAMKPPPKIWVSVPDLRGQTTKSAAINLVPRLTLGTETDALDPAPKGQIFDQNPPPGARVQQGSAVNVSVSSGGVYLPDVTRLSQAAASQRLAEAGLATGAVSTVGPPQPSRSVVSQRPAPGALVSPGTAVELAVSEQGQAPSTVTVPNITQMPDNQASGTITGSGVSPGSVTPQPSSQPAGTVIAQDPPAGSMAAPGTPVNRFVSQPAQPVVPPVTVPPLAHLTVSQARNILTTASLDLGEQTGSASEDALVSSQSPEAYAQVQPHTQIAVVLEAPVNRLLWEIVGGSVLVFAGAIAFIHPLHLRVIPHRNPGESKVAMKIGDGPDLSLRITPHRDPGRQQIRS